MLVIAFVNVGAEAPVSILNGPGAKMALKQDVAVSRAETTEGSVGITTEGTAPKCAAS
jgi:hypothetical protein